MSGCLDWLPVELSAEKILMLFLIRSRIGPFAPNIVVESLRKLEYLEPRLLRRVIFLFKMIVEIRMKTPESPLIMTNKYCCKGKTGTKPMKNPRPRMLERTSVFLRAE